MNTLTDALNTGKIRGYAETRLIDGVSYLIQYAIKNKTENNRKGEKVMNIQ